jgi:hypothetical protein
MPNELQQAIIPEVDHGSDQPEWGKPNTKVDPPTDVQLLRATAFDHILAREEVVPAFTIQLGECHRMFGASLEGITEVEANPRIGIARAGAAAVVAAEN